MLNSQKLKSVLCLRSSCKIYSNKTSLNIKSKMVRIY